MLYGRHLVETGKAPGEYLLRLRKVLALNPNYGPGLYWRARAYERVKNLPAAEADALQAAKIDPGDNGAPLLLVTIYRKEGNLEKAQEYADRVQQIAKDRESQNANGRALRESLDRGEQLLGKGQYAEAIPEYQVRASSVSPIFMKPILRWGCVTDKPGISTKRRLRSGNTSTFSLFPRWKSRAGCAAYCRWEKTKRRFRSYSRRSRLIRRSLKRARLSQMSICKNRSQKAIAVMQPELATKDADAQLLIAESYRQLHEYIPALKAVNRALAIARRNRKRCN